MAITENFKGLFEKLESTALRSGALKNPWILRLSDAIPVKEKWRRMYVTLAAHLKGK